MIYFVIGFNLGMCVAYVIASYLRKKRHKEQMKSLYELKQTLLQAIEKNSKK